MTHGGGGIQNRQRVEISTCHNVFLPPFGATHCVIDLLQANKSLRADDTVTTAAPG